MGTNFCEASYRVVDRQKVCFFGVYEVIGGSELQSKSKKPSHLKNLSSHADFIEDTKTTIVEVFRKLMRNYLIERKASKEIRGSTLLRLLWLLGESAGCLAKCCDIPEWWPPRAGSSIFHWSVDHKPDRSDERQRIETLGGTWRVGCSSLFLPCIFGDKLLNAIRRLAEPEIQEEEIEWYRLYNRCCDGLWECHIPMRKAVAMVEHNNPMQNASRSSLTDAYARGELLTTLTCVVLFGLRSSRPDTLDVHLAMLYRPL
ncbi:hypothetical protein CUMW_268710 [Citrus unshiu]|uniref:PPM-type phosphatase domain-containing protein n=1 Tax=Citrus unshiu TaxID=55188 RepID=A0A2H5QWL8_CITUN|nr:hypothetical protein CUMW_268710 [Citrus unshiu]